MAEAWIEVDIELTEEPLTECEKTELRNAHAALGLMRSSHRPTVQEL